MKKIFLLLVAFALSGCSYLTEFFIYNNAGTSITIDYKFKHLEHAEAFRHTAKIKRFNSLTNIKEVEDQSALRVDTINKTVSCTLKLNEALWIGADSNFSLESEYQREKLRENLVWLEIEAANQVFSYDSVNILKHFKTLDINHVGMVIE